MSLFVRTIVRKREGGELTEGEIADFVRGVTDGRVLWDGRTWRTGDVRAVLAAAAGWRDRIRSSLPEAAAK